ncbi:hypothetical protein OBBRIDRAFT_808458 [Obba rivulosa]|uniref:Uncharacterized protein n=1 Tax=Obba rivulosa TaxID=1052685 RepID=A0A8E2AIP5_9APHY|nr:hypothetical protein OBBRIDRAFT_808458 [Obba rivulosa]
MGSTGRRKVNNRKCTTGYTAVREVIVWRCRRLTKCIRNLPRKATRPIPSVAGITTPRLLSTLRAAHRAPTTPQPATAHPYAREERCSRRGATSATGCTMSVMVVWCGIKTRGHRGSMRCRPNGGKRGQRSRQRIRDEQELNGGGVALYTRSAEEGGGGGWGEEHEVLHVDLRGGGRV